MAYRLLYPLRTYLVVSGRLGEEVNVMTADWVTVVSGDPFIVAVAISPKRYTHGLIKRYREFVLSIPDLSVLSDVWVVGVEHGPGKLNKTRFVFKKGLRVGVPIIENAVANLECVVIGEHDYGDHTLFIGEVVAYHYDKRAYENHEPRLSTGFIAHIAWNKFTTFREEVIYP